MSYDITLNDPITGDVLRVNDIHFMTGGTFAIGGTNELWLNITYNYSDYYYGATKDDPRFDHWSRYPEEERFHKNYGIRGIYKKTGADSIPMLEDMIKRIEEKYKRDGKWITSSRTKVRYVYPDGTIEPSIINAIHNDCEREEYTIWVNEGDDEDYWEATAVNAIKPLYKLIAMAKMRPDGVWDGD